MLENLLAKIKELAPQFREEGIDRKDLVDHLKALQTASNESQVRGPLRANHLRSDIPMLMENNPEDLKDHLNFIRVLEDEMNKTGKDENQYLQDWYDKESNPEHPLTKIADANTHQQNGGLWDYLSDTVESKMSPLLGKLKDLLEGE
jgi:hypothetical protein